MSCLRNEVFLSSCFSLVLFLSLLCQISPNFVLAMSSSSRRSNKKRISYAEVDSDVDLESDQEVNNNSLNSNKDKGGVKKAAGDTYGTTEGTSESLQPCAVNAVVVY